MIAPPVGDYATQVQRVGIRRGARQHRVHHRIGGLYFALSQQLPDPRNHRVRRSASLSVHDSINLAHAVTVSP